jgi:hypothetical protein
LLTLFCPSRGRPKDAIALAESFARTTSQAQLYFLVDNDDPTKDDYPQSDTLIGEPTGDPTGPLNRAALASEADIVGFIGDDSRLVTPGWDVLVEGALRTPGFAWGSDGHDAPWPSTVFISSSIVRALGYMVPVTLRRGFFDSAWVELAERTQTARVVQANFPHDNSKGDPTSLNYDPAYRVNPAIIAADEVAFRTWVATQMPRDIQTVRHLVYA